MWSRGRGRPLDAWLPRTGHADQGDSQVTEPERAGGAGEPRGARAVPRGCEQRFSVHPVSFPGSAGSGRAHPDLAVVFPARRTGLLVEHLPVHHPLGVRWGLPPGASAASPRPLSAWPQTPGAGEAAASWGGKQALAGWAVPPVRLNSSRPLCGLPFLSACPQGRPQTHVRRLPHA